MNTTRGVLVGRRQRFRCVASCMSLAVWLATASCIDPAGRYDDFVRRKEASRRMGDAGTDDPGGPVELPEPEQVNGTYLYVVSLAPQEKDPTIYLLEVEAERDGDMFVLRMRQRPLAFADRKTPVGEWSEWDAYEVTPMGTYETPELTVAIPAAANVLAVDTVANIVFKGNVASGRFDDDDGHLEFFCGDASGVLVQPPLGLNLVGHFTATRIPDPNDPDTYPEAVINCEGDPARPL
jgi:hypothetical protein